MRPSASSIRWKESRVGLDDHLDSLLPAEVSVPQWEGRRITLRHLATQSSGIPKRPRDSSQPLPPGYDPLDPYAAYSSEYVYNYLGNWCQLQFEPGTRYLYSNTGMGLLGHVLGLVDETSYEQVLFRDVLEPLGMNESSLWLSDAHSYTLAPGHDESLDSVPNYHAQDVFQGAGFLKSTLDDMMLYLEAQMGVRDTPLKEAIALSQELHFEVGDVTYGDREGKYQLSLGLAWHMDQLPEGYTFHCHGGRTNGYMAHIAYDLEQMSGVVILCNQSSANQIIRFGEDLLKAVIKYEKVFLN